VGAPEGIPEEVTEGSLIPRRAIVAEVSPVVAVAVSTVAAGLVGAVAVAMVLVVVGLIIAEVGLAVLAMVLVVGVLAGVVAAVLPLMVIAPVGEVVIAGEMPVSMEGMAAGEVPLMRSRGGLRSIVERSAAEEVYQSFPYRTAARSHLESFFKATGS
jgi:hypothetical protein